MNNWYNDSPLSNVQNSQQQPNSYDTPQPSSIERLITPFAAEYSKFIGMETRRNPEYNFLWANENVKNYISGGFYPNTENNDLFTFDNGIWMYTEISNGKKHCTKLFYITIDTITLLIDSQTINIECVVVKYSTGLLTDIAVIPYNHYKEKRLKEYFRIHQMFRFVTNKRNIINEFLYMLISTTLKHPECLILYKHQGWNLTNDNIPVFISASNYPIFVHEYLSESLKRRSILFSHENPYDLMKMLWDILPDTFEVKLMLTIRAVRLGLFFMFRRGIMPQQAFLFEASDPITLNIASKLLKTNSVFDTVFPSLGDKPEELKQAYSCIYDGIAITIDHSNITDSQRKRGFSTIIDDIVTNNYSTDGARHIHVILSESSSYYKDSEKLLHLHLPQIVPKKNPPELSEIMGMLDYVMIQELNKIFFNKFDSIGKMIKKFPTECLKSQKALDTEKTIFEVLSADYPHISIERRALYRLFIFGIKSLESFKEIRIDDEFGSKLDEWFMSVDMSGNRQEFEIINRFSKALDIVINDNKTGFEYISSNKQIIDRGEIILHDDDYIYLESSFIDTHILPVMKGDITHRQLIRALDAGNIIESSNRCCQQLSVRDENGNFKAIYRYAIKRS